MAISKLRVFHGATAQVGTECALRTHAIIVPRTGGRLKCVKARCTYSRLALVYGVPGALGARGILDGGDYGEVHIRYTNPGARAIAVRVVAHSTSSLGAGGCSICRTLQA